MPRAAVLLPIKSKMAAGRVSISAGTQKGKGVATPLESAMLVIIAGRASAMEVNRFDELVLQID
jgi:hypothetical protein